MALGPTEKGLKKVLQYILPAVLQGFTPYRYGSIFNGLWIWILAKIQVLYKESWLFVIATVLRFCSLILVVFFWFNMLSSTLIVCSHIFPLGILCFMNHFNSSLGVKPKLMSLQHCWLLAAKCQHLISVILGTHNSPRNYQVQFFDGPFYNPWKKSHYWTFLVKPVALLPVNFW